ncbi:MAG: AAA family ATPase [Anaerolineae bacterium]|nr:AAA family ATPase [Anaerolineae bacterium]
MKRVLLTGMSGTGKSTVIRELLRRGYKAIDTDYDGWSHWINMHTGLPASPPAPGEYGWEDLDWVWHEERMQALLSVEGEGTLFVAGTTPNQGKFYARFDQIILLSAPAEVIIARLATRTNNPYGATPRTLARVLEHLETVEPRLRAGAGHEIDTREPVEMVVARILQLVEAV